ncbi:MAG TPA: alpha/beta hydrolase [Xanthobacteraceae bacterium]|nr:alpha/beta hydrolase [Xanthobacteraceae bacterium]
MRQRLDRRNIMRGALALALLPQFGARVFAQVGQRGGSEAMSKHIVMLHGANEGGWCFDRFRAVFESLGWTCHAPDLIGHGGRATADANALAGVGMAEYRAELEAFLDTLPPKPVLLGHSMGAILAQQLAAQGLARALVLIAPAPRAGILPQTDAEKELDQNLMALGPFWKSVINPDFDLAKIYTLNRVPAGEQRAVFDKFGPESGLAFFQMFFWMFDRARATAVDTAKVECPVLCVAGSDDALISLASAKATAAAYPDAAFWTLEGHGHMLVLEPGAEDIARRIAAWIPR